MKPSILSKLLSVAILAFCFSCSVDIVPDELTPENINLRQNGGCQLTIMGNIVNMRDYQGLEGVTLESDLFSEPITTDEEGNFLAKIFYPEDGSLEVSEVTILKDGFVENTFSFDANKVLESGQGSLGLSVNPLVTTIEWSIGVTPLRAPIDLAANGVTTVMFEDIHTLLAYDEGVVNNAMEPELVEIITNYELELSADVTGPISITPNHNFAYGLGIDSDIAKGPRGAGMASFHIEAPEDVKGTVRIQFIACLPFSNSDDVMLTVDGTLSKDEATKSISITIELDGDIDEISIINASKVPSSTVVRERRTESSAVVTNCGENDTNGCDELLLNYNIPVQILEVQEIDLPANFSSDSGEAAKILVSIKQEVNRANNRSSAANETQLSIPACSVVEAVTSTNTISYTGVVCGYRFKYTISDRTNTNIAALGNCSIVDENAECHQSGCN